MRKCLLLIAAIFGLGAAMVAAPNTAEAQYYGGYGYRPYYAPPPVYYAPPPVYYKPRYYKPRYYRY